MLDNSSPNRDGCRSDDSESESSPDWYVKQWLTLCKMLDVSDPDAALERVRDLQNASTGSPSPSDGESSPDGNDTSSSRAQEKLEDAGLSSVGEALARIRELEETCAHLDSDNDASEPSSTADAGGSPSSPLPNVFGIRSHLAAQKTLSLAKETKSILREQVDQPVATPPLSASPDDILSTMRCLRDCAETLRTASPSTENAPDTSEDIEAITGVGSVEDAHELDQAVRRLYTHLSETISEVNLPTDSDNTIRSTIDRLTDQMDVHASTSRMHGDNGAPALSNVEVESDRASTPSSWTDTPPASTGDGSPIPSSSTLQRTVCSMQAQLESLYAEKEALLTIGIDDGREAAGRLDELKARVTVLQHRNEQQRQLLERLKETIGTLDVDEVAQMTTSAVDANRSASAPSSETSSPTTNPAAVPARPLPSATLDQLDHMTDEALNDLSVGALRLDDEGRIEYVNEAGLQLPGLDGDRPSLEGTSLFRLVPSTSNTLFLTPFRKGVQTGQMDVCFSYTFVSADTSPAAFVVHLYRAGPSQANWLLLERT